MVVCISSIDFTVFAMVETSVEAAVSRSVNLESTSVALVSKIEGGEYQMHEQGCGSARDNIGQSRVKGWDLGLIGAQFLVGQFSGLQFVDCSLNGDNGLSGWSCGRRAS